MAAPARRLVAAATIAAALLAGCGDEDGSASSAAPASQPAPSEVDFPRPDAGQTLADLRADLPSESLVLAPSVSVLESDGRPNRFAFGVFDVSQRQIAEAEVAVYFQEARGGPVEGPYPARYESLAVEPQFQSQGTASDPDAASGVYVADVPFDRPGRWQALGVVNLPDGAVAATPASPPMEVVADSPIPEPGEPAPRVSTPTVASAAGAIEEIDTRVPPAPELHDTDFADVVGQRPAVLLFATPALCQSRVCGPVVDVALQVKAAHDGEDVAFIHQEVFVDNQLERGFRPQLEAFDLRTEPWAFAIDREGKVAARLEGAFSVAELENAVAAATRG